MKTQISLSLELEAGTSQIQQVLHLVNNNSFLSLPPFHAQRKGQHFKDRASPLLLLT